MTELEIAESQVVQLRTQCVLLRGEVVTLKEKLAAARREISENSWNYRAEAIEQGDEDERNQAEIDREEKGEHDTDLERSGH